MAYQFSSEIDILAAAVGSDETNFPVALVLTDGRFATTGNGGRIENTDASGGASGGLTVPADLVVGPNKDGSSEYDFEFVDYNAATGYMELWAEITALSSSVNTPVIFAYGDQNITTSQEDVAGTWDANFKAVYHLGEGATTAIEDSTGANDGTKKANTEPAQIAGQIGYGQDFDGTDDEISLGDAGDFDFAGDSSFTLEAWIKTPQPTATYAPLVVSKIDFAADKGWSLYASPGTPDVLRFYLNQLDASVTADISAYDDIMFYVGAVKDSTNPMKLYFNGSEPGAYIKQDNGVNVNSPTGLAALIGDRQDNPDGVYVMDGIIDEVRISNIVRGANYFATSYANQNDPTPSSTFWSALGHVEAIAACSLARNLGFSATGLASTEAQLSEGVTRDVALSATAAAEATVAENIVLAITLVGLAAAEADLTEAKSLAMNLLVRAAALGAVSEGKTLSVAQSAVASTEASTLENIVLDLTTLASAATEADIAEAVSLAMIVAGIASAAGSIGLLVSRQIETSATAETAATLILTREQAIAAVAAAVTVADLSLDILAAISLSATLVLVIVSPRLIWVGEEPRAFTIAVENRAFIIAEVDRTLNISGENRTVTMAAESRALTIEGEGRALTIEADDRASTIEEEGRAYIIRR